jgi:hypothetical protein
MKHPMLKQLDKDICRFCRQKMTDEETKLSEKDMFFNTRGYVCSKCYIETTSADPSF